MRELASPLALLELPGAWIFGRGWGVIPRRFRSHQQAQVWYIETSSFWGAQCPRTIRQHQVISVPSMFAPVSCDGFSIPFLTPANWAMRLGRRTPGKPVAALMHGVELVWMKNAAWHSRLPGRQVSISTEQTELATIFSLIAFWL